MSKKIPKTDKDNLNLLINTIGKLLKDKKLIGIVEKNFHAIVYADVDAHLSFEGHATGKKNIAH